MAEPKPQDASVPADAEERDRQIEALLVDGLDAYMAGRYDEAVHVWTRVLFLDRTHARARAYIDRARAAMAERQRRGDLTLEATRELLDRGETAAARNLLRDAVDLGGDDERATSLRQQLDRAERAQARTPVTGHVISARDAWWGWPPRRGALVASAVGLIVLGAAIAVLVLPLSSVETSTSASSSAIAAAHASPAAPVTLTSADVALVRGRTLYAHGRLSEALAVLAAIDPSSDRRPAADALRIEIDRLLLATAQDPSRLHPPAASGR